MFTKKPDPNEIANSMEKELASAEMQKQTEPFDKFESAVNALNKAAEIFDDLGLVKEAEYTTTLLEVVAGKKKPKSKGKSKSKSHKSTRKTDSAMKGLTSEKMVENLKHKGWVFNADDNDAHGHSKGCMCSQCIGDVNDIRHGDDCVCMLCMNDSRDRYKMDADDCNHDCGGMHDMEKDNADDWNLADLFDMHDFEDELDLPHSRRRV